MPRVRTDTGIFRALGSILGLPGSESIGYIQTDEIIPTLPVTGSAEGSLARVYTYQVVRNIAGAGDTTIQLDPWGGDWETVRPGIAPSVDVPDPSGSDFFFLTFGLSTGTAGSFTNARVWNRHLNLSPAMRQLLWWANATTQGMCTQSGRNPFEQALPWRYNKRAAVAPIIEITSSAAHQAVVNATILVAPQGLIPYRAVA